MREEADDEHASESGRPLRDAKHSRKAAACRCFPSALKFSIPFAVYLWILHVNHFLAIRQ
jgi:hypothetical protein